MTDRDSFDRWLQSLSWWEFGLLTLWTLSPIAFAVWLLLGGVSGG